MKVTHEPDLDGRPVRIDASLLVLALLAFAVGGISGFVGAIFRLVLEWSDRFRGVVIDWARGQEIVGFALFIGISAIAAGWAARLVRKFAPGAKGSGIPDVEAVLHDEQPPPPLILIPVKFLGGVLAMGTGLALGREGPTVQMGASIGHFLATASCRNQDDVKALLAAGAGAGLATAFSAPVAGAVFVLEELVRRFDTRITVTTLCASGSAIAVARLLLGNGPDFRLEPLPYSGFATVPIFVAMGAIAGLIGIAYNHALLGALATAERLARGYPVTCVPLWSVRPWACSPGLAPDWLAAATQLRRARWPEVTAWWLSLVYSLYDLALGLCPMRQGHRVDCLPPCWSLGPKAVSYWEHFSAAGSLTWLNAQRPLPSSAWPRSSPLLCVLR